MADFPDQVEDVLSETKTKLEKPRLFKVLLHNDDFTTMLATFGFLVWLHRHKKFDGQVLIAYGFIYSTFRFFIEFLRDDPQRGDLFGLFANVGLSPSQIISLLVAIVSLVFLIYRMKTVSKAETPPVESVPDV